MDDEPMWAADRVVTLTPGFAINIPETLTRIRIKAGGIFLYKTPNQAYQLLEYKVLLKLDWAKNQKPKSSFKKTVAFANEGSSKYDIDKIMAQMDAMTMKMDALYKEMQSHSNHSIPEYEKDDKPISPEAKAKFMQTFYAYIADKQSGRPSGSLPSSTQPNPKVPPKLGDPGSFLIPYTFSKAFSCNALADLGASINSMPYSLYAKLSLETLKPTKMSVRLFDLSFQHPIGITKNMLIEVGKFTFLMDLVIVEMEEDKYFDALLDEGSEILHSIEGTIIEKKLFAEFDEFMAMNIEENSESKSKTEETPIKKITFDTNYKIKTSLEELHSDLELKPLPNHLEYEVIKNGNKVLKKTIGETEQEYEHTTTEEKQDRRNEMKARGTMYRGNKESKKVQRTLLKQQHENFTRLSSKTMDQTFDRLQKLISQLEIQGEFISQEDMNLKLLRSLPFERKTHVLIWRNKVEIETISLDNLYNNLKIYEPELTGSSTS
ncbi:reverse transcriptase domain-containing protein [Tanacetum coccineum]|uniref:Reverse transcriptase domain-containing protein n=1 Tax=Tanacetum coccineum TaxID=301880 RepID=A0ABQ5BEB2_9ASTR